MGVSVLGNAFFFRFGTGNAIVIGSLIFLLNINMARYKQTKVLGSISHVSLTFLKIHKRL